MKIGIDGRNLISPLSGINRYILEMSRSLADQGHDIYFYLPSEPHASMPSLDWAKMRIANAAGPFARLIWGQTILPRQAECDGNEILWGPAHRLPSARIDGTKKVLTIHDLVWRVAPETMARQTYWGERLLMNKSIKSADVIMADTLMTKDILANYAPAHANKICVVYPIVRAKHDLEYPKNIHGDYLLFVGTLEPRKNLKRLVEAWSILPQNYKDRFKLVICGKNGWGNEKIETIVAQFKCQDSIIITGFVTDSELRSLYAHTHGLLMPSLYEGFGYPVIEAQQFGKRVLTSKNSSMSEIGGKNLILVDPLDIQSIAKGLKKCLDDDNDAHITEAKENAARFLPEVIIPKFLDHIRTALNR